MFLAIYVEDFVMTGSDVGGIKKAKELLKTQFGIKDMRKPRYFLGLKLLTINKDSSFSNRSMLWIYYKKLDYLAASQCVLLWMLMLICEMRVDFYLRMFLST